MAKENEKKNKKSNVASTLSVFSILAVVVLVVAIIAWNGSRDLQAQINDYEKRKAEVTQLIENEKERATALEERKKYIQTKQYTEEIAKEKFNLVYPDEVILKRKDK